MNAPVKMPEDAVSVDAKAEPAKPVAIDTIVPDAFRALAERLKVPAGDVEALFVGALTTVTLTPELALAMPGGRALVQDEYALGLRSTPDGALMFPPGSYKDAEIKKALDARYPTPTKRVRNEFLAAFGACWYADGLWMTATEIETSGHPMAVDACAEIGGTDAEYPRVLALRDEPPELEVPLDDPRDAIK